MRIDDEQLLRELGKRVREEEGAGVEDDRWEACCRGEETPAEALRDDGATAEDARLAAEIFRPLDAGFKAELVREVQAEAAAGAAPTGGRVAGEAVARRRRARVGWSARRPALAAILVTLVVTVAGAVYLLSSAGEDFDFVVEVAGHARNRAAAGTVKLWRPEVPLAVELEAVDVIEGPLDVAVIARRGSACLPLERDRDVLANGSIALRVYGAGRRGIAPGDWTLVFVVARPGRLPAAEEVCRGAESGRWQAYSENVRVPEPPR